MGAGAMDQQITIERRASVADGIGGSVESWAEIATVWAAVKAKAGREVVDQGRVNASFVNLFEIYSTDVTELDRILWQGERWNIRGILREGSRALRIKIEAERGVAP